MNIYLIQQDAQGSFAANAPNHLKTYFKEEGVKLTGDTASASDSWGEIGSLGYGRPDQWIAPGTPDVATNGDRVEYRYGGYLLWYSNNTSGLEQGFIVQSRPGGSGALELRLRMAGVPLALNGATLTLSPPGRQPYSYSRLKAWDSAGRDLPARFALIGADTLAILVDDTGAQYPVMVDPILSVSSANPASGSTIGPNPTIQINYSEAVVETMGGNGALNTANYVLSGAGAPANPGGPVTGSGSGPYSFSLSGLTTGALTITLQNVGNLSGNVIGSGNVVSYTVDATAPTVAVTYSANPANAGAKTITATYSELVASIPNISINQPGTTDISATAMTTGANTSIYTYSYTVNTATGGTYIDGTAGVTLSSVADAVGNAAGAPSGNTFTIDTTAPTVSLTYSANPAKAGTLTVTAHYSEAMSGTPNISIDQPGTTDITNAAMTNSGNSKDFTYNYTVNTNTGGTYVDGTATVSLSTIADPAGNNAGAPTGTTFGIDTIAPTVVLTYSVEPVKAGPEVITAKYSELLTSVPNISINQPGTTDISNTAMTTGANMSIFTYTYTVNTKTGGTYIDGTATVSLSATVDSANNSSGSPSSSTFVIDTTRPTISSVSPAAGSTITSFVPTLTVTFSENVTNGTTSSLYSFAGNAGYNMTVTGVAGGNAGPYTLTRSERTKSGNLMLAVSGLQDFAGNITSASNTATWTVQVGTVAQYKFAGGAATDTTANGLNGTLGGSTAAATGNQILPDGLEMNTTGTLTVSNLDTGAFPQDAGSLMFWFKPSSVSDTSAKVFDQSGGSRHHFYIESTATPGTYTFAAQKSDNTLLGSSNLVLNLNIWNHVALTWSGTTITCYLNGKSAYSVAQSGWRPSGQSVYMLPKGQIDEWNLYDSVQSSATISAYYLGFLFSEYNFNSSNANSGNVTDITSNYNDAALYGAFGQTFGHHNTGNAVDLRVNTRGFASPLKMNLFPSDLGTLQFWVSPDPVTATSTYLLDEPDTARSHFFIQSQSTNGLYKFALQDPASAPADKIFASANVMLNPRWWNHIAFTWSNVTGNAALWVNGNSELVTSIGSWRPTQQILGCTPQGLLDDYIVSTSEWGGSNLATQYTPYPVAMGNYSFESGTYNLTGNHVYGTGNVQDLTGSFNQAFLNGGGAKSDEPHHANGGNSLDMPSGNGMSIPGLGYKLLPQRDGTVRFWLKPHSVSDSNTGIFDNLDNTRQHFYLKSQGSPGQYRFGIQDATGTHLNSIDFGLLLDRWNHIAITWTSSPSSQMNFYMDGNLMLNQSLGSWLPDGQLVTSTPNGALDNLVVERFPWSATQLKSHFDNYITSSGNWSFDDSTYTSSNLMLADISGKFNHGKFSAIVSTTEGHQESGEGKILDNGIGVRIYDIYERRFHQEAGTIHGWVKPFKSGSGGNAAILDVSDASRRHFSITGNTTAGSYLFNIQNSALGISGNSVASKYFKLDLNIYNHIAITWSTTSGTINFYVNNIKLLNTSMGSFRPNDQQLISTPYGVLDDWVVETVERTSSELNSYFNRYITPVGLISFETATVSGGRARDAAGYYNHVLAPVNLMTYIIAAGGHHSTGDSLNMDGTWGLSIPTLVSNDMFPQNEGLIRFWIKPNSGVTDSTTYIFDQPDVLRDHFYIRSNGAEGLYRFGIQSTTLAGGELGSKDFYLDVGSWNMIAINWSSNRGDINLVINDDFTYTTSMGTWRPGGQIVVTTAKGQIDDYLVTKNYLSVYELIDYYRSFTPAVTAGVLYGWGNGVSGELGTGSPSQVPTPKSVTDFNNVINVAGGYEHTLVLLDDGTLWGFGANGLGQIGDGTQTARSSPVQVNNQNGLRGIACGKYHSIGLLSNGTVTAWGSNGKYQLGQSGNVTLSANAIAVSGLSSVTAIAAGGEHNVALISGGTLKSWGAGTYGQLGNGGSADSATPVTVAGLTNTVKVIACGNGHSLALLTDGTIMAWGRNQYGQCGDGTTTDRSLPVAVSGITTATNVMCGEFHSLALLTSGNVVAWGRNVDGQLGNGKTTDSATPVYATGLTATAIAAGGAHSLALKSGGNVATWGDGFYYQIGDGVNSDRSTPVNVVGMSNIFALGAGGRYSLALMSKATYYTSYAKHAALFTFDDNTMNDMSGNKNHGRFRGSPVSSLGHHSKGKAMQFSGNTDGFYADTLDQSYFPASKGTLRFWVKPHSGTVTNAPLLDSYDLTRKHFFIRQNGSDGNYIFAAQDPSSSDLNKYVTSTTFGLALDSWNFVSLTWDSSAQKVDFYAVTSTTLSSSASISTFTPTAQIVCSTPDAQLDNFELLTTYTSVGASGNVVTQSSAGNTGNFIRAWGYNGSGVLGDGTTTNRSSPVLVPGISYISSIGAGLTHTLALLPGNDLKAFGNNDNGQLGNGTYTSSTSAVNVSSLGGTVTALATGPLHNLILLSNGNVQAWGSNSAGQLGSGVSGTKSNIPVSVSGLSSVSAIAVGKYHSLALKSDGTVWAWGLNKYGQLGNGTTTDSSTPVQVLTGVSSIACGLFHSLALLTDGTVRCWGYNSDGQLGNGGNVTKLTASSAPKVIDSAGTELSGVSAIAAGAFHSLAIVSGGIRSWGMNAYGQLGNGSTTQSSYYVSVSSISTATKIRAGVYHSAALLSDGTVRTWGDNQYGQLGNGSTTNSSTPVTVSGLSGVYLLETTGNHIFTAGD